MPSDIVQTAEILTGPENFPLWKVKVIRTLRSNRVYGVISGTTGKPTLTSTNAADVLEWEARDEKAHGIIQEWLSDPLLLKTEACGSAKELWEKLQSLLDAPSVSSAFYIFQRLFSVTWDVTEV